ncbi:MAG: peptidoglycan recognition family protein [Armatimonadota bacterium]
MPTEREVTMEQFRTHLDAIEVRRRIDEVVVHHTWSPAAGDYRGTATVRGVRRYHTGVRGWSDNGYHVMIGPDGAIFLCRPMARAGAHVAGRNAHTIGVSLIANFDRDEPAEYAGLAAGHQVVAALVERFDLSTRDIRFHREFAAKTCPGLKLGLAQFRRDVVEAGAVAASVGRPKIVLLPGSEVVECNAAVEDGTTRVDLRPLAEALGCTVHDRLREQGKVYVRRDA